MDEDSRMNASLVSRTQVIQRFIDVRCYKTYLEIGYGDGENFELISVDVKHAVDPYITGNPNVIAKTSDQFFAEAVAVGAKYDIIFIDGLHTHDQVARDHVNALLCLKPKGVILLHDVNPTLPGHVRKLADGETDTGPWTGDAYKAWTQIRRASKFWTATILSDFGVGIVDSSRAGEMVNFDPPASFEEFEASRELFLKPIRFDDIR
jgi:hypothetical protein